MRNQLLGFLSVGEVHGFEFVEEKDANLQDGGRTVGRGLDGPEEKYFPALEPT